MRIPHFAFNFSFGNKSCNGVNDDDVNTSGTDEHVSNFKSLLAGVRLRDKKIICIDAKGTRVDRVQRMFGIDKSCVTSSLLRTGNSMQGNSGLARGFWTVDFDDSTTWQTANSQRNIQR